jgi:hypothetical protein
MSLHALQIPDDPASLAGWLEEQLTGLELAALAGELSAIHGRPAAPARSVRDILGIHLEPILQSGLGKAPSESLRQLLLQPGLLLELQEMVLVQGGTYWDKPGRSTSTIDGRVEEGRRKLEAFLLTEGDNRVGAPVAPRDTLAWYRRPSLVSLATAASVLLAVYLFQHFGLYESLTRTQSGWGWSRPSALRTNVPANEYLNRLADAAEEWFNKRPDKPTELAQRLNEFRQGCSTLILAEHRPLAAKDRQWLVEKCRAWAQKLNKHLADLEAGRDLSLVQKDADETVNKLKDALRTRAREISAADTRNV